MIPCDPFWVRQGRIDAETFQPDHQVTEQPGGAGRRFPTILPHQLAARSPLLSMDSTATYHRNHRQRPRAREPLLSQQALNLNATTRSPRVSRDPRLQHDRAPIVEPHRSHFRHPLQDKQFFNRHSVQRLSAPFNSPARDVHDSANTAIETCDGCRLSTRDSNMSRAERDRMGQCPGMSLEVERASQCLEGLL